jgi:hypothetical protein
VQTTRTPAVRAWAERILRSTWALAVVVGLLTWQPFTVVPAAGLDPSWDTALYMAADRRLDFGTEVIFTYGPLGFLWYPLAIYGWASVLAAIYHLVLQVVLCATVLWAARRSFSLPVAVAIAFVTAALNFLDPIVPIAFTWCAVALGRDPPGFVRPLVVYAGAAVCAIEVLVKINTGLVALGMCAVAVIVMPGDRRRSALAFAVTFLAALAALWLATGQGAANFDDYLRSSFEIAAGYTAALVSEGAGLWTIPVAILVLAAAAAATFVAARGLPTIQRLGLLALIAMLGYVSWKEGFVRHDPPHVAYFFAWMLAPWFAFRWAPRWRLAAGVAFALTALLSFPAAERGPGDVLNPIDSARGAVDDVTTLLGPGSREEATEEARETLTAHYAVDPRTLELLGDRPVHVAPWEASLAWAYGLTWEPLPVFQSNLTYTPELDRRNAAALSSEDGPERILRTNVAPELREHSDAPRPRAQGIDDRYGAYESPASTLAMLCHFAALRTTRDYQVLGRIPDRCGPPRALGSVTAAYGETIEVPPPPGPDEMVLADVRGVAATGVELIRSLLYRPARRFIVIDGTKQYRLVAAVTGNGLLMSAPGRVDFPRPFQLAPAASTIALIKDPQDPGIATANNELEIDFYAVEVSAPGARR